MAIKDEFLKDLNDAATVCHWGDTVRLTFTDGRDPMCNYLLADLAAIDPRLPVVIPAMAIENGVSDRFDAEWLRDTLTFWQEDAHILLKSMDMVGLIREIGNINYKNDTDKFITFNMFGYYRHRADGVQFIARSHWGQFDVPTSDLDEQFPGWRVRFKVLQTLGAPQRELIDSTLTRGQTVTTPTTLPNQDLTV